MIDAGTVGVVVSESVLGRERTWYDVQWAGAGYARWFMTSDQIAVVGYGRVDSRYLEWLPIQ